VLLDPSLDIFKPFAEEQQMFRAWRKHMYEEQHITSPNGQKSIGTIRAWSGNTWHQFDQR